MNQAAAILGALGTLILAGTAGAAQPDPSLRAIDADVVLPIGAHPKSEYVRYYRELTATSPDDLPFTTMIDGIAAPVGRSVVAGIFVLPGEWGVAGPAGVRIAQKPQDLPYAVHGGCRAVNVLIDAKDGQTIASWCNIDDGSASQWTKLPAYIRAAKQPK